MPVLLHAVLLQSEACNHEIKLIETLVAQLQIQRYYGQSIRVIRLNIFILISHYYSICMTTFCFVSTFEIIYSSFCNSILFGHH